MEQDPYVFNKNAKE